MGRSYTLRIRLTSAEVDDLKVKAGIASVSAYVRSVLFPAVIGDYVQYTPPPADPVVAKALEKFEKKRKGAPVVDTLLASNRQVGDQPGSKNGPKTCEHGTKKGYHCWQCGGLAKV